MYRVASIQSAINIVNIGFPSIDTPTIELDTLWSGGQVIRLDDDTVIFLVDSNGNYLLDADGLNLTVRR